MRRWVRGKYQIDGPTLCASAPSHRYHAMPPRRTRNSDRPRASDRTMVATELNRLPSFKSRRTLSPLEMNRGKGRAIQRRTSRAIESHLQTVGWISRQKNFSATSRRRSFFVDIPFYRTNYLGTAAPGLFVELISKFRSLRLLPICSPRTNALRG